MVQALMLELLGGTLAVEAAIANNPADERVCGILYMAFRNTMIADSVF
jgi:hypothetical protein